MADKYKGNYLYKFPALIISFLMVVFLMTGAFPVVPQGVMGEEEGIEDSEYGSNESEQIEVFDETLEAQLSEIFREKSSLTEAQRKIDFNLLKSKREIETTVSGLSRGEIEIQPLNQLSSPLMKTDDAGNIEVKISVNSLNEEQKQQLESFGMSIQLILDEYGIIEGTLPYNQIETVAELDFVKHVGTPGYAIHNTGTVTSAGDSVLTADAARSTFGVTGSGIKVGVMSDGVTHLANSVATGDLPGGVQVLKSGSGDEGTAMLEIIYDLAPGASLAFYAPSSSSDMVAGINSLEASGANIVVDDITYLDEPYFEDGPIALETRQFVNDGGVYVTSAGNNAQRHYLHQYVRTPLGGDWDYTHDYGGGDIGNTFTVPAEVTIIPILQWNNQWGNSSDDFDLLLVRSSDYMIIGGSINSQTGAGCDPYEAFAWTNDTGAPLSVFLAVAEYSLSSAPSSIMLNYHVWSGSGLQYVSPESSVIGHSAVQEVLSCAAVSASTPDTLESFSSRGPGLIYFPSQQNRQTPNITGTDGVQTYTGQQGFFQSNPFLGTSASAPHIAAIAALIWDADPTLTPAQVRNIITSTADDISPAGYDYNSGYGHADAYNALDSIFNPPTISNASGATNISNTAARLNGNVVSTGGLDPNVYIYWGTLDKGTNQAEWANNITLGVRQAGSFYEDISGLNSSTTYYYRCYGVNSQGGSWASATANFTTLAALTIYISGNGTTSPTSGTHYYTAGTVVTLTAIPAHNWGLVNWTGNVSDPNSLTTNVTMDADKTVTANFTRTHWDLTMAVNGSGTTDPEDGKTHSIPINYSVNITANAGTGWLFYNWAGDTSDIHSASANVTMDADKTVTAYFYRHPPIDWIRTFSNGVIEEVIQTSDGGYIFTGYKNDGGDNDVWVVKRDASGNPDWEEFYGDTVDDRGRAICEADDGGFVIGGYRTDGADKEFWVFKIDDTGNESGNNTWSQNFSADSALSISPTADGGYIAAGYKNIAGNDYPYLGKLDSGGNITWQKSIDTINGFSSENCTVTQTADGGYAIFGTDETAPGNYNAFLIKTDAAGNETFQQTYGEAEYDYGFSGLQTADGGYVVGGGTVSYGYVNSMDAWLVKTDASGNVTWRQAYGGSDTDEASCVIQTGDGGYALTGFTYSYSDDANSDAWVVKTDASGNIRWHYNYDNPSQDDAGSFIRQTSDGGLIIGANTGNNVTLFKLAGATLNINVSGSGTVNWPLGNNYYDWGRTVTITATPASGYQFVNWTGGTFTDPNSSTTTICMYGDYYITANFAAIPQSPGGGGGGGGGTSITKLGPKTTTALRGQTSADGEAWSDIEAFSNNMFGKLVIPNGTKAKNKVGVALLAVTITELNIPNEPQAGAEIVGTVYDLGPEGANFDPPATFTITYKEKDLPEGVSEDMLCMATWDETTETYIPIDFTIDMEANKVSAPVSHFSMYTILAAPSPAKFALSGLTINPAEAYPGESIGISVTISNNGDLSGNYTCELFINNAVFTTETITLNGNTQRTLDFSVPADEAGTYNVDIGGLKGGYTVSLIPASFEIKSLTVSKDEIEAGESVDISVIVSNTGQAEGVYEASLKVNGAAAETRQAIIAGGASETVTFTYTAEKAGLMKIEVNGLAGEFTVKEKAAPVQTLEAQTTGTTATAEPESAPSSGNGWIWIPIVLGCSILAVSALFYIRRRKTANSKPAS